MGKMFKKTFEINFSHISVSSHEKKHQAWKAVEGKHEATCAALSKTSTSFEPFPSLWGDFFYLFWGKKELNISKEMGHTQCVKMAFHFLNVQDKITSIWPSASKAYVYKKKWNAKY